MRSFSRTSIIGSHFSAVTDILLNPSSLIILIFGTTSCVTPKTSHVRVRLAKFGILSNNVATTIISDVGRVDSNVLSILRLSD